MKNYEKMKKLFEKEIKKFEEKIKNTHTSINVEKYDGSNAIITLYNSDETVISGDVNLYPVRVRIYIEGASDESANYPVHEHKNDLFVGINNLQKLTKKQILKNRKEKINIYKSNYSRVEKDDNVRNTLSETNLFNLLNEK